MAEISIGDNHRQALARAQHVLEWLFAERARLESELAHVVAAGAREQARMVAFLQRAYGLDAAHTSVTVDSERGVLIVPDEPAPAPPDTSEPCATSEPVVPVEQPA